MKMSRAVLTVGLAFGLSGAAWAGAPATGLGQQWPNAADLSRSPGQLHTDRDHAHIARIGHGADARPAHP